MKLNKLLFSSLLMALAAQAKAVEMRDSIGRADSLALSGKRSVALDGITVKGELPLVKAKDGVLTYDMKKVAKQSTAANAYELLLQLPGVYEQQGTLMLAGAGGVSLMLDSRPSTLSTEQTIRLLKNMPVSKVNKVEVLYNAPVQYRVKGAVINILLKTSNREDGWQGELNAAYSQKYYANANGGLSLTYTRRKFSLDVLYSADCSKTRTGKSLYSSHWMAGKVYPVEQFSKGYTKDLTHNVRLNIGYAFTPKTTLNVSYTGAYKPYDRSRSLTSGTTASLVNSKSEDYMHNVNADFKAAFGFNVGVDYTHYTSPDEQHFDGLDKTSTSFISNSNQTIDRWKIYLGQEHKLSSSFSLNYGTDIMIVRENSHQVYHALDGEDMSASNSFSNQTEYTYNLYAGVKKQWGNLSIYPSLSAEYYKFIGAGKWSLYPTLQMSYMQSVSHILQFSFSAVRSYPPYWMQQQNRTYMDGYTVAEGNPDLKSAVNYKVNLNYILKSKYIFGAYGGYNKDGFIQLPYQSTDNLTLIFQMLNVDVYSAGVNVIVPFKVGKVWESRILLDGSYNRQYCSNFHGTTFDRHKWMLLANWNNTVTLSSRPDLKLELSGFYISPNLQGLYTMTTMWQVNAGVKWGFWHDKAELRLRGSDLFNSFYPKMKVHAGRQNMDFDFVRDLRTVTLSFTYRFGGFKQKSVKDVDTERFGH